MPERHTLRDADGVAIATYLPVQRDGRDVADLLELEVPVERALPAILEQLRGFRVAGPVELGHALVAAGGRPARHAHIYSHDLRDRPGRARRLRSRSPPSTVPPPKPPAYLAAHPPDHVDSPVIAGEDSAAHLARVMAGAYGRLLDSSGLAVGVDGRVVGGILVAELADPEPPFEGAWVMELFRDPGARGAGRALLERALALTPGPAIGLAVTDGNPAARLYERLGFRRVLSAFSVDV